MPVGDPARGEVSRAWARGTCSTLLALLACGGDRPAPAATSDADAQPASVPAPRRPNVVLIVLDDLDAESMRALPRTAALIGEQGLTFDRQFVSLPLCAPARASLLTGRYAHNHGVRGNGRPQGGFGRFREQGHEARTFAAWLHASGYRTMLAGKYLNDYPAGAPAGYVPPGWDEWHAVLEDREADSVGYFVNDGGQVRQPQEYQTDYLARLAADFVRASPAAGGRPFLLYLSTAAPHHPSTPAPRHAALFEGERAPRPPSFNEADVSDKPAWLRAQPELDAGQERRVDKFYRRRLQTLAAVDEMVEGLFGALQAAGELERTYVFLTSDNGYLQGQHRFPAGKNAPYEESIRVPLLVRGPGVPRGQRRTHLVSQVDLAPTVAALARAPAPDDLDGRSLVPLLGEGPPAADEWRGDLLIEHYATGDPFFIPEFFGLRTATQAYFEYASGDVELYDLERDPYQLESRHRAEPALTQRLSRRLAVLKACRGANCR